MISILISVLIAFVVLYVGKLVIAELGLPASVTKILYLIVGLLFLAYFLDLFGIYHLNLR